MRVRKKSWTPTVIQEAKEQNLLIEHPRQYKGKWKKRRQTDTVHVEIGAGKGDYVVDMSSLDPSIGWVAIEKDMHVAAYALKKSFGVVLENGKFIIDDANLIDEWFEENEIDTLHLNFSDPWPKKAHHKRRLTTPDFASKYQKLLKNQGQVILKTDNAGFFEDSLVVLTKTFQLEDVWVNYRQQAHPEDAITEYEQRFIELNQPIYRVIWRNNK